MSAIYKEGQWYGGVVNASGISVTVNQKDLSLNDAVKNIIEDLAPIETNFNQSANDYVVGDLLVYDGTLYKVITPISEGDPLLEGVNISKTTITQGVDLTDRVVALENKTQKISQNNDILTVNDTTLNINNYFGAGSSASTAQAGLVLKNANRRMNVLVSGSNAGLHDGYNRKWLINSNDNGSEIKTDASTFVCGSTATTGKFRFRAANNFHAVDLLASDNGKCGVLDAAPDKWLIFLEATTNNQPNTIKTSYPFYLNSTTVADLTSRGTISGGNTNIGNTTVTGLTNTGNSVLKGTTVTSLTNSGNTNLAATTVNGLTNTKGNTNLAATSVTSLTNTGNTSLKGTSVTSLNSSGEIITSTHLSAGTDDATGEHVCRVRNKYRRLQFSTGNSSSSASPAGIWDLGTGKTGWVINSQTRNNRIQVEIPQVFLTKTVLDSTLRPPILTGGLSNTSIMIGAIYGEKKGMRAQSYFEGSSYVVKHFAGTDSDRRLKTNIKLTSRSGLDLINQLEVVEFDWKNNNQHWDYGIVAQDAAKIDKNIVIGEEKEDEYLAIDTLYLVDALVKATQELSAEVDQLKERVKILEKEKNKKSQ